MMRWLSNDIMRNDPTCIKLIRRLGNECIIEVMMTDQPNVMVRPFKRK